MRALKIITLILWEEIRMNKLLTANFARLRKNHVFLASVTFMIIIGILFPVVTYQEMLELDIVYFLQERAFWYPVFLGFILSIFCSLFIGTDNSDNTIRNKIIVGHTRNSIYLSNLITCMIVGVVLCLIHTVVIVCVGTPLLGFYTMEIGEVLGYTVAIITMTFSFSAIYTLISMKCQSKATIAVICLMLWFCLLFISLYVQNKLLEPEMVESSAVLSNIGNQSLDMVANPDYISGTMRDVFIFLSEFLPSGQAILFMRCEASHWGHIILYNIVTSGVLTVLGMFFFRHTDLK